MDGVELPVAGVDGLGIAGTSLGLAFPGMVVNSCGSCCVAVGCKGLGIGAPWNARMMKSCLMRIEESCVGWLEMVIRLELGCCYH